MSEIQKFLKMTKPLKFRRTRTCARALYQITFRLFPYPFMVGKNIYRYIKNKIRYYFNFILYKLNIIKRYTYSDVTRAWNIGDFSNFSHEKEISARCVFGTVRIDVLEETYIDQDYFYFNTIWKPTYVVKDIEEHRYVLKASLARPGIIIGDKKYRIGEVPVIMRTFNYPQITSSFSEKSDATKPQYTDYNLTKLQNISRSIQFVPEDESHILMIEEKAIEDLKRYLDTINLVDLEV